LTIVLNDRFGVRVERSYATAAGARAAAVPQEGLKQQPKAAVEKPVVRRPPSKKEEKKPIASMQAAKQLVAERKAPLAGQPVEPKAQEVLSATGTGNVPKEPPNAKDDEAPSTVPVGSAAAPVNKPETEKPPSKKKVRKAEEIRLMNQIEAAKAAMAHKSEALGARLPENDPAVTEFRGLLTALSLFRKNAKEKDGKPPKGGKEAPAASAASK